jgi:hypothetical protein
VRRVLVVVVSVLVVAAAAGCSDDDGPGAGTTTTRAPATTSPSGPTTTRAPTTTTTRPEGTTTIPDGPPSDIEAIVLAECDPRSEALLGVAALSPETGEEVGRRETGLADAEGFGTYGCSDPGTATDDLQFLAAVTPSRADPAKVGIYDLESGDVHTAPATEGPQSDPALIGEDLWFVEGLRPRILHRWPAGGRSEVVGTCPDEDTGAPDADDPVPPALAVAAYRTCQGIDSYRLLVAPDGSRLVAGGSDSVLYVDASTGTPGRLLAAAGDGVDVCRPQQWVSPTSYLCLDDVVLATIDLAAGTVTYRRLAPEAVPGTRALSPVASPDGRRVAFISCRARACTLQVVPTAGGEPVEVGPLPDLLDPYLVTWSRVLLPTFVPHDGAFATATATARPAS